MWTARWGGLSKRKLSKPPLGRGFMDQTLAFGIFLLTRLIREQRGEQLKHWPHYHACRLPTQILLDEGWVSALSMWHDRSRCAVHKCHSNYSERTLYSCVTQADESKHQSFHKLSISLPFFLFNSHVTTHLRQVHAQKECNRTTFAFHRLHDRISLFGALEKGNSDPSETKIPWGMAHLIQPQVFLFGTHKLIPLTFKPG